MLEVVTTNGKMTELIDYVNKYNPSGYDYPVPNIIALPIVSGNSEYIKWVKAQVGGGVPLDE